MHQYYYYDDALVLFLMVIVMMIVMVMLLVAFRDEIELVTKKNFRLYILFLLLLTDKKLNTHTQTTISIMLQHKLLKYYYDCTHVPSFYKYIHTHINNIIVCIFNLDHPVLFVLCEMFHIVIVHIHNLSIVT